MKAQGFKLNGNLPGQRSLATALHSFSSPSFIFDLHMIKNVAPKGMLSKRSHLGLASSRPYRSSVNF